MRARLLLAISAAVIGAVAAPALADAPQDYVDFVGRTLFLQGGYQGHSELLFQTDRRAIVITGNRYLDLYEPSKGCDRLGRYRVRCIDPEDSDIDLDSGDDVLDARDAPMRIAANTSSGDDRIHGSAFADNLDAYYGDDVITGGRAADRLYGNEGADRLSGGPGNDYLDAGAGEDVLGGGPGRDRLYSDDGVADRRIDCGAGATDYARIDPADPRPRRCEAVERL